jgi:hypothetical protein
MPPMSTTGRTPWMKAAPTPLISIAEFLCWTAFYLAAA